MEKIEWNDVQGLLLSGYPQLPFSAYMMWRFRPDRRDDARRWLADIGERLMRADSDKKPAHTVEVTQMLPTNIQMLKSASGNNLRAINLALTASGLRKLDLDERWLSDFSLEFLEGMAPAQDGAAHIPRRSNLLGDTQESSPELWDWGGWTSDRDVDGLLLLYAVDEQVLQALVDAEIEAMAASAEVVTSADHGGPIILKGRLYDDRKEHFGFTDGISQPTIEGSPLAKRSTDKLKRKPIAAEASEERRRLTPREQRISLVKPGEFVLGYRNERRERISSQSAKRRANMPDLLRNGTYLVFRQLEQDIDAFDGFVSDLAEQMHGTSDPATKEKVAARLIGRHKSGEPLVPPAADSLKTTDRNDFLYSYEDGSGMACPIGAHIRRANPRDTIGPDPDTALRLSKMHRIIRRGRPYGARRDATEEASGNGARRGIAFIALNADIAGQFEMIQHSWLNNRHFGGLYAGTDPIGHLAQEGDEFVVQQRPSNLHVKRSRPFVTVRGGGYFFLPGINAVRALAAGYHTESKTSHP